MKLYSHACLSLALAGLFVGSLAQALTVKATDIANKTVLIGVSTASVAGTAQTVLTDDKGISLYTFALDSAGVSNCKGGCLGHWPPEHVPAGTTVVAPFATIQGNDGQTQLTLDGLPLYHYDDDKKPGDAFGQYPNWSVIVVQP